MNTAEEAAEVAKMNVTKVETMTVTIEIVRESAEGERTLAQPVTLNMLKKITSKKNAQNKNKEENATTIMN